MDVDQEISLNIAKNEQTFQQQHNTNKDTINSNNSLDSQTSPKSSITVSPSSHSRCHSSSTQSDVTASPSMSSILSPSSISPIISPLSASSSSSSSSSLKSGSSIISDESILNLLSNLLVVDRSLSSHISLKCYAFTHPQAIIKHISFFASTLRRRSEYDIKTIQNKQTHLLFLHVVSILYKLPINMIDKIDALVDILNACFTLLYTNKDSNQRGLLNSFSNKFCLYVDHCLSSSTIQQYIIDDLSFIKTAVDKYSSRKQFDTLFTSLKTESVSSISFPMLYKSWFQSSPDSLAIPTLSTVEYIIASNRTSDAANIKLIKSTLKFLDDQSHNILPGTHILLHHMKFLLSCLTISNVSIRDDVSKLIIYAIDEHVNQVYTAINMIKRIILKEIQR